MWPEHGRGQTRGDACLPCWTGEGLDKTSGPAGLARAKRRYTEVEVEVVVSDGGDEDVNGEDEGKMGVGGRGGGSPC